MTIHPMADTSRTNRGDNGFPMRLTGVRSSAHAAVLDTPAGRPLMFKLEKIIQI